MYLEKMQTTKNFKTKSLLETEKTIRKSKRVAKKGAVSKQVDSKIRRSEINKVMDSKNKNSAFSYISC